MAPGGAKTCTAMHIAINSMASYNGPRKRLLHELIDVAGVPTNQIHVFLGGASSTEGSAGQAVQDGLKPVSSGNEGDIGAFEDGLGVRYYYVPHNSVDFTGIVHLAEAKARLFQATRWFYMHDTTSVGAEFWKSLSSWCRSPIGCGLPLTRYYPSSSMGLYSSEFLASQHHSMQKLRNPGWSVEKQKKIGFGWEDYLFKQCDASAEDKPIRRFTRRCYNATLERHTCVCSKVEIDPDIQPVYGAGSSPRQVL